MKYINRLVNQFRDAKDISRDEVQLDTDLSFYKFPHRCCGYASDLLAKFLLENGIRTYYAFGTYRDVSLKTSRPMYDY